MGFNESSMDAINADEEYSNEVFARSGKKFTLTVLGTFVGVITIQFRDPSWSVWYDLEAVSSTGRWGCNGGNMMWRAGFKTGGYTSGAAVVFVQGSRPPTKPAVTAS